MVNLDDLKATCAACGAKVAELKKAGAGGDEVKAAVAALLAAKTEFAANNDGIGPDGKPFDPNASKRDKKKAAAKPADGEAAAGPAAPTAENAAKKAAKAAEKAAKKAAAKDAAKSGKPPPAANAAPAGANKPPPAPAAVAPAAKAAPAAAAAPKAASKGKKIQFGKVEPLQLCFSPNAADPVPFVTLLSACILNIDPDLTLKMDIHRTSSPALGTHGKGTTADAVVQGDVTAAKYFLKTHQRTDTIGPFMGDASAIESARVEEWVEYSLKAKAANATSSLLTSVESALESANSTFLAGPTMTFADVVAFDALGGGTRTTKVGSVDTTNFPANALRWFTAIDASPAALRTRTLIAGIDGHTEFPAENVLEPLVPGCHTLEGAIPYQVCTRFPPEPSGYLHIGHAKAVLLNDYYATRYKGKLIVRFDDTNPSKEKEEYQQSIVEDLAKLGVYPDIVTYTSDYFEQLRSYALDLINEGKAYMDDTPQEEMQTERMARQNSKRRGLTIKENLEFFAVMESGSAEGAKWCMRGMGNMQSVNGTMRDPVFYRQNTTPHHRSGDKYKAYPTYDLACPIVDSVEGVTHALRTTEYNDRDEQYAWVQNLLRLRRTRIHGFARMNFMFTELSKRKLTWFVENGHVTGWDDPRFPTVRGVVRRGINIKALRSYILGQGASRRITLMEWSKFWAENKKHIDDDAKRFMAVSEDGKATLNIKNVASDADNHFFQTDNHPKFPAMGKRLVKISNKVYLEASDLDGVAEGEEITLMRWGVVKITKVDGAANVYEGEFMKDSDPKVPKRKATWLSESAQNVRAELFEFDNLINKPKLEEGEDFKDFINENNLDSQFAICDAGMKALKVDEVIQIERRGLFRVDAVGSKGLKLFMIPDGKSKAMSTLSTKLVHR